METRTLKVLAETDVARIADTYHAWREKGDRFAPEPGFSKAVKTSEIASQGFVLTPGLYLARRLEEDAEPLDAKMARLTATLRAQMGEAVEMDEKIRRALAGVGYGW